LQDGDLRQGRKIPHGPNQGADEVGFEAVVADPGRHLFARQKGRDVLDIESQATLLKTGLMATIWGAQIIVSRRVPTGRMYVCAEPEFFGRIPVRTELSVLSADDPKNRVIGFSCFENLGIGAHNPLGLTRVVISR
jgi:hypothetical protein